MSVWFHIFFGSFVIFSSILHVEFNLVAPTPFHDENCHLNQVQYYCNGTFDKWNKTVTTLPGLYFFTLGALKPLQWIFGLLDGCSMLLLRSLSLVTGFGIFILMHLILSKKYPEVSEMKRAVASLNLAFFPMLYFYYFMYYTESLSMLLLLLMHFHYLNDFDRMSAFYGALGVLTRQTNIVWVFWHALMKAWNICGDDTISAITSLKLPERESIYKSIAYIGDSITKAEISAILPGTLVVNIKAMCRQCFMYIVIGVCFIVFVILNDGIVVGDRKNHIVCLNPAQFLYFSLYSCFFLFPSMISRLGSTFDLMKSQVGLTCLGTTGALAVVHWKTIMHWYLLTDNRHYIHYFGSALYIWYPTLKYALVPLYVISWFWIFNNLEMRNAMKACLIFAIGISVLPQLLMEFRYFVPGFIYIRLHLNVFDWKDLIGEFILYAVINYLTFYQFLYQPWETASGVQRIMW